MLEEFQAVWVGNEGVRLAAPETLVGQFDGLSVPHGAHNGWQPSLAGWDLFEENSVSHIGTLVQEIVHRQRLQQPLLDAVTLHVFTVGNIISEAAVVLDFDAEGIVDGLEVVMEGALRHPFAQFVDGAALPQAADFIPRDVPVPVDGVNQPYVPVKIVLCHIFCFNCFLLKGLHIPSEAYKKL